MLERFGTTRRVAGYFILFYSIVTLLLGLAFHTIGDRALRLELDDRLRVEADYLGHYYRLYGAAALQKAVQRRDDRGVNTFGYLFVDRTGRRLAGELSTAPQPPGWHDIRFVDQDGEANDARALVLPMADGGSLMVAMEVEANQALRRTEMIAFILGVGVMLIGGIAGGILLSRAVRGRLDAMNGTARAIIGGDMSHRVPIGPANDEFDRLAQTFNQMLDRNNELISNLRQMSSDIAHDLRTPLARLRQRLERISDTIREDGGLQAEVDKAIEESNAILSLFAALLRIAEVESGSLRRYFRTVDLSEAVARICDSYGAVAEDSGRRLECAVAPGLMLNGDEELISQALVNLLENAIRHTPAGTRISVALHRRDSGMELVVADDGPGVPQTQWAHLTKRFTRGDRSRNTSGFGLGLNLVQAVVTVHGGTMSFSDQGPGLGVTIRFQG